ncbi:hypothetical protein AD006_01155 [Pseudonocardia sp. EC080610-09]|uniref:hypothetical protein n=1 Tax=unclassified Pseudonocardia TaxID=2619320 RepID=UPI0007067BF1|nr:MULTISPECIES: hypothetical protein [unclassified Pseudonocardia]ALL74274.1 hypothetical protein AD006_01155 [Pseudonocardia sp. EC080610-09]ALL81297.1 hypothetical protein AD017_08980 [Pseudonocardia sp. EC080619-01]
MFIPTAAMENEEIIPASPVVACLTEGAIELELAANDDEGTSPLGVAYHVIETVNSVVRQYVVQLKASETEVDLASVEKGQTAPKISWPAVWS